MLEPIADRYSTSIMRILKDVMHNEATSIDEAGKTTADSIAGHGILHAFGAGHSQLLAGDITYRAGGLPWVNGVLDPALSIQRGANASSLAEKIPELADSIFAQIAPDAADVTLIICNSGVTPVSVRWAKLCKKHGLKVISIVSTESMGYFEKDGSETLEGHSDLLIDNHCPLGDAGVIMPNENKDAGKQFGPTSSVVGSFIVHWLIMSTVDELAKRGKEVSAFRSGHIQGAAHYNRRLAEPYKNRVGVYR